MEVDDFVVFRSNKPIQHDHKDLKDQKSTKTNAVHSLQGPITLTHHVSSVYNKNVYVFGEIHDTEKVCADIRQSTSMEQFLDQTLKADSNRMIDIFIEQPYVKEEDSESNTEHKQKEIEKQYQQEMKWYQYELEDYEKEQVQADQSYLRDMETYKSMLKIYEEDMVDDGYSMFDKPELPVKEIIQPPTMPVKGKVEEISEQHSLFKLVHHFRTCFQRSSKDKCLYPNARVHLTDVRQELRAENYIYWLFAVERSINNRVNAMEIFSKIKPETQKKLVDGLLSDVEFLLLEDGKIAGLEDFKAVSRITKNLKNIKDSKLANAIAKWFDDKLKTYNIDDKFIENAIETYKLWLASYQPFHGRNKDAEAKFEQLDTQLDKITRTIADFGVLMVDYYTVTRIFRSFTPKSQGQYSQPAKDVIIYVGDAHAENYREFFQYMKFQQVESTSSSQYVTNIGSKIKYQMWSCLDISKIKQPLFS